jgi:hypothetical protein
MNAIVQEDDYGCGLACIASVLDISYRSARALFLDGTNRAKNEGFYCPEIVEVLKSRGLEYANRYIRKTENAQVLATGTIVFLKRGKLYPAGHFLVKSKSGWLDPWINFPSYPQASGVRDILPDRAIYMIYPLILSS